MISNQYLLKETEEAKEMRKNILNMLTAKDINLVALALQLIEGGGIHQDFVPWLSIIALFKDRIEKDNDVFHLYKNLLDMLPNALSEEDWAFISQYSSKKDFQGYGCSGYYQSQFPNQEDKTFEEVMQDVIDSQKLQHYWRNMAMLFFEMEFGFTRGCASICYKYNLLPLSTIIAKLLEDTDTLELDNFDLEDLLPELQNIKIKTISFKNCTFSKLPKATWQNHHVMYLSSLNSISIQNFKRLLAYFPSYLPTPSLLHKVFDDILRYNTPEQIYNRVMREKYSLSKVLKKDRDAYYYSTRALVYLYLGSYEMAQVCYKHIQGNFDLQLNDNHVYFSYNTACHYAKEKNKKELLKHLFYYLCSGDGMRLFEYRKVTPFIFINEALKPYQDDSDVQTLVKRYDELSYDKFLEFRIFYES